MPDQSNDLERRVKDLEEQVARLAADRGQRLVDTPARNRRRDRLAARRARRQRFARQRRGIRRTSQTLVWGLPLWEISCGPDAARGERHGYARAVFAIGDQADGLVAIGGIARGGLTIGGISAGVISIGGLSFSLLAALGGVALAPFVLGGVAIGGASLGGVAIGVYARGPTAVGLHVVETDPPDRQLHPRVPGVQRRRAEVSREAEPATDPPLDNPAIESNR